MPTIIYEEAIPGHGEQAVDITISATPERYRLADCRALVEDDVLCLQEFTDRESMKYSAISYVWRGLGPLPSTENRWLKIKQDERGDRINVEVLRHAAAASLHRGIPHIWMDRLCIMQTNTDDKNWQIRKMFGIYQDCSLCIVLPGGMQRLVRLDEETTWIHRGWTLQEVLAPPEVHVLFEWRLGSGEARGGEGKLQHVQEVMVKESAMASMPPGGMYCGVPILHIDGKEPSQTIYG